MQVHGLHDLVDWIVNPVEWMPVQANQCHLMTPEPYVVIMYNIHTYVAGYF